MCREGGQQLDVVAVTCDDLDILAGGTLVSFGGDDRVDTGGRWGDSGANRFLSKRAGGVAQLLVHIGDMGKVEKSTHVIVVADMPGEDALGEHGSRYDQVRGKFPQHAEPGSPLLIQRSKAFDRSGVENDDQPAALCTLRADFARTGRRATAVDSTLRPEATHFLAAAMAFADGAPWVASSSFSHASSCAILD